MLITHSVEEAIYLASRIVVATARPARIKEIIDVPIRYPRDESLQERAEFVALHGHQLAAAIDRLLHGECPGSRTSRPRASISIRASISRPLLEVALLTKRQVSRGDTSLWLAASFKTRAE